MGTLYLAQDPNIGRLVALKLLHRHLNQPDFHDRFVQEARSAGALSHPNIVTIHDFGEFEGSPFIVMEYVRGETVAELIGRRPEIPIGRKLRWLEGLCAGLAHAHDARIIHRDVKPQNLIVDQLDMLKILDFGIARVAESALTRMSMQIGTPGYMSPEQIEGAVIDSRSDVFAVGAVAYELLSYRAAFRGSSAVSIMNRVLKEDPEPLSDVCEGLHPELTSIVHRALRKKPLQRYDDMDEMRFAIQRVRLRLDSLGDSQVAIGQPAGEYAEPRPPRRRTDQAEIARRRAEQIERYLVEARSALRRGDEEALEDACEELLLLDPHHAEARQLLEQARGAQAAADRPTASPPGHAVDTAAETIRPGAAPRHSPPPARVSDGARAVAANRLAETEYTAPTTPVRRTPPHDPARRRRLSAAAALGAVLVAAIAWYAIGGRAPVESPPAEPSARVQPPAAEPVPPAPTPAPPVERGDPPGQAAAPPEGTGTIAAPAPPSPEPPQAPDVERMLKGALAFEEVRRLRDALREYDAVLAIAPDQKAAIEGRQRVKAALAEQAERTTRARALVRRANDRYEAGDYQTAIEDLRQALNLVPQLAEATTLLTRVERAQAAEANVRKRPGD